MISDSFGQTARPTSGHQCELLTKEIKNCLDCSRNPPPPDLYESDVNSDNDSVFSKLDIKSGGDEDCIWVIICWVTKKGLNCLLLRQLFSNKTSIGCSFWNSSLQHKRKVRTQVLVAARIERAANSINLTKCLLERSMSYHVFVDCCICAISTRTWSIL